MNEGGRSESIVRVRASETAVRVGETCVRGRTKEGRERGGREARVRARESAMPVSWGKSEGMEESEAGREGGREGSGGWG